MACTSPQVRWSRSSTRIEPPTALRWPVAGTVSIVSTNRHSATFLFLDENDREIADADNVLAGFQVHFGADITAIKIKVVSQDNLAAYTYTITDLGNRYDANDDGVIQRDEVISAIKDYFNNLITREETIEVIKLYFPVDSLV